MDKIKENIVATKKKIFQPKLNKINMRVARLREQFESIRDQNEEANVSLKTFMKHFF